MTILLFKFRISTKDKIKFLFLCGIFVEIIRFLLFANFRCILLVIVNVLNVRVSESINRPFDGNFNDVLAVRGGFSTAIIHNWRVQIFNGIHMLGLKRFLHNRRVRRPGYRYTTQNGDNRCYLVYDGVCWTVCGFNFNSLTFYLSTHFSFGISNKIQAAQIDVDSERTNCQKSDIPFVSVHLLRR